MRMLLGGLAATFAVLLSATPAGAETFNCPITTANRSITNTLPSGWYTTPVRSRLTETRVDNIGGQPTMVCVYSEAGNVLREVAAGQTCTARSGGFECASSGGPAPMPTSDAHSTGTFAVRGTYEFDLDEGAESPRAVAEFWYEVARNNETYFTPRNGARIAIIGASEPGYAGCTGATYTNARTRLETLTGPWLCVRTNEGRVGQFRIDGVDHVATPRRMTITHTTWR